MHFEASGRTDFEISQRTLRETSTSKESVKLLVEGMKSLKARAKLSKVEMEFTAAQEIAVLYY